VELTLNEAEARLSEIVTAAQNGEPAVELVRCREKRGAIDFDKLEADRRRLGIRGDEERWPEEFNDPAFSRHVLGLEEDE
jgi:antitoxin (DNA-binding transcriptional repressor) of toxin-antitoxin stability system